MNRLTLLLCLVLLPLTASAASVAELLKRDQPPPGVVFEIVDWNDDFLREALPSVRKDIQRLRERFPDLDLAVVTHGSEQFALMTERQEAYQDVHELTRSLVSDAVPVHVCGTHASWKAVTAEDFPDYVDVAPSAPARINDYLKLDYVLVRVD